MRLRNDAPLWPKGSAIEQAVFTIMVLVATFATLLMAGFASGQ